MSTRLIAVHGKVGMAETWPQHIKELGYQCRIVDGLGNDIVAELRECEALLWHLNHDAVSDLRFARSVLLAAGDMGLRVYTDHATAWHFDDKVAQKYMLEAIHAPLAKTWVFFNRDEASSFLDAATYPLVFKLRGGAGSLNVRLVRNRQEARRLLNLMFGRGYKPLPIASAATDAVQRARRNRRDLPWLLRNGRRVVSSYLERIRDAGAERGYLLLQEFIDGNDSDIRVMIVGHRAFSSKRQVRPGDFRASGSGLNTFSDSAETDLDLIEIGFDIAHKLRVQSLALDFVYDPLSGAPVLLEVSYVMPPKALSAHKGYFDSDLNWHAGSFDLSRMVLEDLLATR